LSLLKFNFSNSIPAALNIFLEAVTKSEFSVSYLLERYFTVLIHACIINFAHSLQGNSYTYIVAFLRLVVAFNIALASAWTT